MTTETVTKESTENKTDSQAAASSTSGSNTQANNQNRNFGGKREFKKNKRSPRRKTTERSEFSQKILDIRRVTRVSSGGRRFSFSVAMVIGNRNGKVGIGTGKGGDTALAVDKAVSNAKKNLITVSMTNTDSIPHMVKTKYSSARIMLMPSAGKGVAAGSAVRDVLELAGLNDVAGKIISGSKNKLNIAQATVKALKSLKEPKPFHKKKAVSKGAPKGAPKTESK